MLFCTLPLLSQYTVCHVVDFGQRGGYKSYRQEQDTMHARKYVKVLHARADIFGVHIFRTRFYRIWVMGTTAFWIQGCSRVKVLCWRLVRRAAASFRREAAEKDTKSQTQHQP